MICPHCMQQKSLWATKCPHCTHQVEPEEQLEFSSSLLGLKVLAGLAVIALLILVDNLF